MDETRCVHLKRPTTFAEQVALLKKRGLTIEHESRAVMILSRINYYRLSAYLLPFKIDEENYRSGTKLENIVKLYEFDSRLRNIIMSAIEPIEVTIETVIAVQLLVMNLEKRLRLLLFKFFKVQFWTFYLLVLKTVEPDIWCRSAAPTL
jgi:abortive infection bacteriophage resistance protein